MDAKAWPELDVERDSSTLAVLHLASQMLGKIRIANAPWVNHGWHATLRPRPCRPRPATGAASPSASTCATTALRWRSAMGWRKSSRSPAGPSPPSIASWPLRFEAPFSNGQRFTRELFDRLFDAEVHGLADVPNIQEAAALFRHMVTADEFEEFLTLPAYPLLP